MPGWRRGGRRCPTSRPGPSHSSGCRDCDWNWKRTLAKGCPMRRIIATIAAAAASVSLSVRAGAAESPDLEAAQRMFYNGRYADAASVTTDLCTPDVDALTACELRTSALLFQLR